MVDTTNPTYTIALPLLEDATNKPWTFTFVDPMNAKLVFEVFRNEPAITKGRELVGRGMALLDHNYQRSHATKRESLSRDFTIPILSTVGLEYIGTVTFSFVISTPLILPNTLPIDTRALWSENGPSMVVGHLGNLIASDPCSFANESQAWDKTCCPLQDYRLEKIPFRCEAISKYSSVDTDGILQSYLSAVRLGASYVEVRFWAYEQEIKLLTDFHSSVSLEFKTPTYGADFPDVQLTKDHIPVVYHDFLVSETGIESPMHTITHEQVGFHSRSLNTKHSDDHSSCRSTASSLISICVLSPAKKRQSIPRKPEAERCALFPSMLVVASNHRPSRPESSIPSTT